MRFEEEENFLVSEGNESREGEEIIKGFCKTKEGGGLYMDVMKIGRMWAAKRKRKATLVK